MSISHAVLFRVRQSQNPNYRINITKTLTNPLDMYEIPLYIISAVWYNSILK